MASLQFEKGIEKTVMWYLFSKTYPSFLTVKEGSTFLTKPLFPQGREDVTALLGADFSTSPSLLQGELHL